MRRKAVLLPLLAALAVGACESSTAPGTARLSVLLTDAPSDYLESAEVEIGSVSLRAAEGGWITVTEEGGVYDLLDLQAGVTALLGSTEIPAGTYNELRMVVRRATVTLLPQYEFAAGGRTMDLAVPSGASSGIKVSLESADGEDGNGGIQLSGQPVLIIDFDVSANFVMQGTPDSGIKGFNFTPRLRVVVEQMASSISGFVWPGEEVTDTLTVEALRAGADPLVDPPATTGVAGDGTWSIPFVAPGTYHVSLARLKHGQVANTIQVVVGESEAKTGVELVIEDE